MRERRPGQVWGEEEEERKNHAFGSWRDTGDKGIGEWARGNKWEVTTAKRTRERMGDEKERMHLKSRPAKTCREGCVATQGSQRMESAGSAIYDRSLVLSRISFKERKMDASEMF